MPIEEPMVRMASFRSALRRSAPLLAALLALLLLPAGAGASVLTVGSPLSVPATLNTATDLSYQGMNTAVPPAPDAPNGIVHTAHWGADTAIWNAFSPLTQASMPAAGQALKMRLEGCAQAAAGGPAPLTQIHFQILSPQPGGAMRVKLSSGAFNVPVCGQGGAGASTVTTYEPVNMCVNAGDYVAFNDEGGYVPSFYPAGVPFQVLGAVRGATTDSFIRGNGTGNGALFSPGDTTAMDGFAASTGEELMMQVELGTGSDARYVCPGGSRDAPPVLAAMHLVRQTDGVNHSGLVSVAMYCRPSAGCAGTADLTLPGSGKTAARGVGHAAFHIPGGTTSHVSIRVSPRLMKLVRRRHGVSTMLVVVMGGQTFTQTVTVKIF
jgi:hypothetical protein